MIAKSVVVSLNTDEFVASYKNSPPIVNYQNRSCVLQSCKYVDKVICNVGDADSKPAILSVMPDAIAIGSDWQKKDYHAQMQFTPDWLHLYKIDLIYLPYTSGISSSNIKANINAKT
mgnify:CR=1 FL=1